MLAQDNEKSKGYYADNIRAKFSAALAEAREDVKSGKDLKVRISNSNSKMGAVTSVSTLPFITCPACCGNTCGKKCYAAKLANLRPIVLKSYAINTALALYKPAEYWRQIDAAACAVRFFRFHVSGDIINKAYFDNMVTVARNNRKTEFLCFTKRYQVVNNFIRGGGEIPENLHILFSGWLNLKPVNPYNIPETNVFTKEKEIRENWKICGGNCFNCACRGVGCWQAKNRETIAFKMH